MRFLDAVCWQQASSEDTLRQNVKPLMQLAGLRDDDEAVEVGVAIARNLVMRGAGPQRTDAIRRAVDQRNLLASSAQLTLAVNAIDRRSWGPVIGLDENGNPMAPDGTGWHRANTVVRRTRTRAASRSACACSSA